MENLIMQMNHSVKYKIQYVKSHEDLDLTFKFPDFKRYFKYLRPDHWDGTLEDLWGLILSSYCGLPVYISDNSDDFHLKCGIPDEFNDLYYQVIIFEDEWCSISNHEGEIIYARFIDFKEYPYFEEKVKKLVEDFLKSEGFEIEEG